ncbi:hypothetical protein QAD02_002147 [Eretmocerus hayati]|uniref:Uncharacterized protein n=1 Tax=Eretmocerus hayati TaxID=131215 RepID=A0ACC2NJ14_9HYME|nr:hypothetical protein QAD02_002147 [Eretmocerus hayati]
MVLENTASTAVTPEHDRITAVEPPTINEQHAQSNGTRTNSILSSDDENSGNINDAHAEALPVARNRRNEVYPLPVDGEKLSSIRLSWCAGKSLSQVVSHLLDNMFTVAELVAHSMFGGAEGGAAWTPLDQNEVNLILNYCHSRFGQESVWRTKFGHAARSHIKYVRKKEKQRIAAQQMNGLAARQTVNQ